MPPGRSRSSARAACSAAASSASALASAAFLLWEDAETEADAREGFSDASPLFFPKKEARTNVDGFADARSRLVPPLIPGVPDDDAPSPPSPCADDVCLAASARRSSGVLILRRAAASFPNAAAAAAAASSSSWSSSKNSVAAAASPRLANGPPASLAESVHRSNPPGEVASAPSATHAAVTAPASAT